MNVNMMRPGDNAAVLVKVLAQGKLESLDGVGHLRRSNVPTSSTRCCGTFLAE
jgi:hypothetical protein